MVIPVVLAFSITNFLLIVLRFTDTWRTLSQTMMDAERLVNTRIYF